MEEKGLFLLLASQKDPWLKILNSNIWRSGGHHAKATELLSWGRWSVSKPGSCVLRCCRIQASSLTSDLAGEGRYVQQCHLSIKHLCWSLPAQLRGRWEKLFFLIPSPEIAARLPFFLGRLLIIFFLLSIASAFSNTTPFLSPNSRVYS